MQQLHENNSKSTIDEAERTKNSTETSSNVSTEILKTIKMCRFPSIEFEENIDSFRELLNEEVACRSEDTPIEPLLLQNSTPGNYNCNDDNVNSDVNILDFDNSSTSEDECTTSDSDSYGNFDNSEEISCAEEKTDKESTLKEALCDWALKFHITLVALTALLLILRNFLNFNLPLDGRTLLGTLRRTETSVMRDGTYHHFGLKRALNGILEEIKANGEEARDIKLIINIDGLPISKCGTDTVWMIMCSELNCSNVYPVGAFCGKQKPEEANEFLEPFVEKAILLCQNGLENPKVNVSVEAIVCDVPAKAFAFYLKGHTGYDSCSKCFITGKSVLPQMSRRRKKRKKRVCFAGIGPFKLKTDADFILQETEDGKRTILMDIPRFGCVDSVPLDYLHLILLGVTKTLIRLWFTGPKKVRLDPLQIQKISKRLLHLRQTVPAEFNRKPRKLLEYKHWKGPEFRTFLLYSGVVALKGILGDNLYSHFLLLHTAVSILISKSHLHDARNIDYANELLTVFVKNFSKLYGAEYVSHNVHNLLHICNDVKKYGVLDNFSSFKLENYFSTVKRMIRTGEKPLQQIARRYSEMEKHQKQQTSDMELLFQPHCSGPITEDCSAVTHRQYKVLKNKYFYINCNNAKDRSFLLNDGSFAVIENVVRLNENKIFLIGKKLKFKTSFYEVPNSKQIKIHVMDDCNEELLAIPLDDVSAKVWRIPSSLGQIVMPLLHYS